MTPEEFETSVLGIVFACICFAFVAILVQVEWRLSKRDRERRRAEGWIEPDRNWRR